MANGRCRFHGGKTPRGERHGAFVCGKHTMEAIAERKKAAELLREANALVFKAARVGCDLTKRLWRGELRREEAEAQLDAVFAQFYASLDLQDEAIALKHAWLDRYRNRRED